MKPPRSILFGPLPPPWGGVSVFMSLIREPARQRGAAVWSYSGHEAPVPGVRYVNHRRFGHIGAVLRHGRGARIVDSTHFHLEYPNPLLLPLWLMAKRLLGFRWVKIVHDGTLPGRAKAFGPLRRWLMHRALAGADELIVYHDELERWLRDTAGPAARIDFLPFLLPPPADWGRDGGPQLNDVLDRSSRHTRVVASVGVFIEYYGFEHVVQAVERLRRETGEDIGVLLVDGGFAADDGYRQRITAGRDWVHIAERVDHPALGCVFKQADVFVRACSAESFGLSRVEALWSGVPVIGTDTGETRGMLLYQFGDVDALTNLLAGVFRGETAADAGHFAEMFRRGSEHNLEQYLTMITGEEKSDA